MRRNIILSLSLLFFIILQGCDKKNFDKEDGSKNDGYQIPNEIVKDVELTNGILRFKSIDHIIYVMNSIEVEQEKKTSEFFETYKEFSDEEKSEIAKAINFHPCMVYEAFEKELGFYSLRADIANKEKEWLNHKDLDMKTNPNNHYIDGQGQRTVINPNGVLIIGNSIYIAKDNGVTYEIPEMDFMIMEEFLNDDYKNIDKVKIYGENQSKDEWKSVWTNSSDWTTTSGTTTYKMTGRITIDNRPWVHYVKGSTSIYWKDGSVWRPQRYTYMYVKIHGPIYDFSSHLYYKTIDRRYPTYETVYDHTDIDVKQSVDEWFATKREVLSSINYNNYFGEKTLYLNW